MNPLRLIQDFYAFTAQRFIDGRIGQDVMMDAATFCRSLYLRAAFDTRPEGMLPLADAAHRHATGQLSDAGYEDERSRLLPSGYDGVWMAMMDSICSRLDLFEEQPQPSAEFRDRVTQSLYATPAGQSSLAAAAGARDAPQGNS